MANSPRTVQARDLRGCVQSTSEYQFSSKHGEDISVLCRQRIDLTYAERINLFSPMVCKLCKSIMMAYFIKKINCTTYMSYQ